MSNEMRDRLVKLMLDKGIFDKQVCDLCTKEDYCERCGAECIADHLIENGVIVPPCKVDDIVYAIGDKDGHQIKECRVVDFGFADAERFQVSVYFECDQDCDGCYFNDWSQSYCGEWGCSGEYGNGLISIADFGKTVFLTKAEAEQKLKEMRGGNEQR